MKSINVFEASFRMDRTPCISKIQYNAKIIWQYGHNKIHMPTYSSRSRK